jgi:hypothetical protein
MFVSWTLGRLHEIANLLTRTHAQPFARSCVAPGEPGAETLQGRFGGRATDDFVLTLTRNVHGRRLASKDQEWVPEQTAPVWR